jgi:hypothetical protein
MTMLATTLSDPVRELIKENRQNQLLYSIMKEAYLDHSTLLIVNIFDTHRRSLSLPTFARCVSNDAALSELIKYTKLQDAALTEEWARIQIEEIVELTSDILESPAYKQIKTYRNKKAAHSSLDEYKLSTVELYEIYITTIYIARKLQSLLKTGVYIYDYVKLEGEYLRAAAHQWGLPEAQRPLLSENVISLRAIERLGEV